MYERKKVEEMLENWGNAVELYEIKKLEVQKLKRLNGNSEISKYINTLVEYMEKIIIDKINMEKYIRKLPYDQQKFLYLRYTKKYQFEKIKTIMFVSRSQIFRIRNLTLDNLITLMSCENGKRVA